MPSSNHASLCEQGYLCLENNNLDAALGYFEKACNVDASNPEGWLMLGLIHRQRGNIEQARNSLKRATQGGKGPKEAFLNLAQIAYAEDSIEEAMAQCCNALTMEPRYAEAVMLMGMIHLQRQAYTEAASCFRSASQLLPESPDPLDYLATTLELQGKIDEACSIVRKLLDRHTDKANLWIRLGELCRRSNMPDDAEHALSRALDLEPGNLLANNTMAELQISRGKFIEAERSSRAALKIVSTDFQALGNLATALQARGKLDEALACLERAVALVPDNAVINYKYAGALQSAGRIEEALIFCQRASTLAPNFIEAKAALAGLYEHKGDLNKTRALLQPLIESGNRNPQVLAVFASIATEFSEEHLCIPALEEMLHNPMIQNNARIQAYGTLGRLYDTVGDYATAFQNHMKANQAKVSTFNPAAHSLLVDNLIEFFQPTTIMNLAKATVATELPVFVVGMPRSGTTLVEQILASHPQVAGAGELSEIMTLVSMLPKRAGSDRPYPACIDDLDTELLNQFAQEYLRRLGTVSNTAQRVVDKMPHNFLHLGLIAIMFPGCRIIHVQRNALDTCLSCFFQSFSAEHSYAYDLQHLGHYYREYERLMHHWCAVINTPLLQIQYEELVKNQEQTTRQIIDFCALDWDDRCLRFHETDRIVATPSYNQVRKPLYSSSIGRWRHYADYLRPLQEILAGHKPI